MAEFSPEHGGMYSLMAYSEAPNSAFLGGQPWDI